MAKYSVRPIPLCKGPRDISQWTYIVRPGLAKNAQVVESCNYVWYIEGTDPSILVDAGANAEMFRARGIVEEDLQSLENGLGKYGLLAEDIDIVILTHLHWDHVGLCSRFSNARFLVQKIELEFARNPHVTQKRFFEKSLIEGLNLEIIEGDQQIIPGVQVVFTPGHTPGGQSVVIETPKGLAIITGFCCIQQNFEPPEQEKDLAVIPPGIHTDLLQVYDSVVKIKEMADIILPLHDAKFIEVDKVP